MKVYRDLVEDGVLVSKEIFDIAECTYTGKDMGERSITATIEFATPIDFQIGDYIKLPMQNLIRSTSGVNGSIASGSDEVEKFYIYTMPTIKKVARAMSNGKAFEHNVTFQSTQYELSCVQMRDLGNSMNADSVIYTGFDNVTFNGAAHELMERIMMVLKEAYHDSEGNPLWSYEISDTVNEDVNLALERFPISFSGNTVMDALLELSNKETINTTFFINNRKIYVGFKRPYFCRVTDGMSIDTNPSSQLFTFQYGKTSDKGVALQYGGLYDITKTVGREVPITKLFAYGASRNLNRYYCSDRVKGGRYVNRLMLPSFDANGKTDFIISEDALQRYGVREATKQFEEIYPSIRYATYGDIRQVKYCIKVKASGRSEDIDQSSYPIARIQCYKVVEGEITGVNKLVEAAPPDDLAIYIHSMDKTVKVVLYGGATDEEAIAKQKAHDTHVPSRVYSGAIPGSCFIVHDRGFDEEGTVYENLDRSAWFTSLEDLSGFTEKQKEEIKLNQINYTDTFWLTDLYIFQNYEQTYFSRDGYSAWSWARLNNKYSSEKGHIASDSVVVNEIVHVEPITISDTNMTADGIDKRQSTFDIYLRDLGFTINEQNDFGDMVFLQNGTVKVSILDGLLAGQEFEISGSINSTSPSCICAFNDDGTRNEAFFEEPDYTTDGTNPQTPYDAFEKGAIWRIRLNRTNVDEADYANLNLAMPTKEINAKQGDHLVLLDIFMPDIYIHAAENRLLREARKYLEANDNGSISYAVNFDKVRMQQIPNYALQMREGLNLRVVDEDLNIRTENNGRYVADYRDNKVFSSTESDHNRVWLSANTPIDFTRGKYYTIEFELYDDSSFDTSSTNAFALLKTKNDATIAFNPAYSVNKEYLDNGKVTITIKFNLPDNFDDSSIYYPSLLLVSEISSNMRMYSHWLSYVFERDFDENTNILNYADFTIDSLTIKITDNSGNNEPIREITATLSEQTNATAWATLMNKVATTAKEGAQNKKAIEEVVNTARKNYQALLSLKDSIFDPDGSCDQVFLQVMMQQVGADSMNYQLDNTRSGLGSDGQPTLFNCSCERGGDGYYHFKVYNNDTLRHYVYTQGSQAGNWEIPVGATGVDVQLNGTESYFVCLKCPKNDTVGQWICSTKQYAVNDPEDDTCWFFNWAILTVDSGGVYTLMETRGNAYMYGDNLVCGKISTMAGNSYFDLTHGNFVLGDGTGPALSYINGVLTISGSKGDAEETLRQLGILSEDVSGLESGLSAEEQARQAAIAAEQAARQAAIQAIQAEAARALGSISNLQEQIDGEVTSWFLEGEPWDNYRPADQWTDQTLKDRHLGDTYTNILPIEADLSALDSNGNPMWFEQGSLRNGSGKLTFGKLRKEDTTFIRTKTLLELKPSGVVITFPTAMTGRVWYFKSDKTTASLYYNTFTNATSITLRVKGSSTYTYYFAIDIQTSSVQDVIGISCDETFTNPEAGKSWRWCNNDDTNASTYHWHLIADSDATKALAEAAKASAAADGKSKTFVVKPTNYAVGDLWILQSDTDHTDGKKGDMLTANAASDTYNEAHWSKEVKYTDDTAVENLEIGGANKAVYYTAITSNATKDGNYGFRQNTADTKTNFELKIDNYNSNSSWDKIADNVVISSVGVYSFVYKTTVETTAIRVGANGSKVDTISKFVLAETIPANTNVCVSVEITNVTQGSFAWKNVQIEIGNKPTSFKPAQEDTDTAIAEAASKAEALGYLKEALEPQNTTTITGGLLMTNVLMLKDLAQGSTTAAVTAGMSGINDDNILMWGGGTYEEAVAAKGNDNYYKSGTTPITTLLKKDGTGKIGIFKISDTQAIVDVPNQGKVIIDASTTNGGIRILNSEGRINAALLPTSISSFKPLTDNSVTGSERSVYFSMSTQSVTSTSKTITLSRTGSFTTSGTTTETLEQYTKKTTITTASTRVGGNTVTLNGSIRTSNHDMFVRVTCELLYNGNSIYSINHTEEVQVGYNYISLSNVQLSFPNSITKTLTVSNSINMQLKVTVTITGASSGAYIDAVSLNVSMGSIYMYYKATTAVTYTYPAQTIIGSDGLISLVSNSKYFMVDNTGSMQKIYAKGLGTTKGSTAGSGELYISNYTNAGLVKTLYDGFAAISEVLEKCKYEGSNAKAQENAKNACTDIRTALSQISIIANT